MVFQDYAVYPHMTLADRIVILNEAKMRQMGTTAEIYANHANTFAADFIGSPPMNLIEDIVANGTFTHCTGQIDLADRPEGPAPFGVRPENIQVTGGTGRPQRRRLSLRVPA
ncbi:MAG: hypothetical protein AAF366_22115 [Pseudomonadota bacterium]